MTTLAQDIALDLDDWRRSVAIAAEAWRAAYLAIDPAGARGLDDFRRAVCTLGYAERDLLAVVRAKPAPEPPPRPARKPRALEAGA